MHASRLTTEMVAGFMIGNEVSKSTQLRRMTEARYMAGISKEIVLSSYTASR